MELKSVFSQRLSELIKKSGVRANDLARAIGVDQSLISKYVHGERLPAALSLTRLADFFVCSADYLLGLTDGANKENLRPCPPFPEQISKLLKHYGVSKYRLEMDTGFSETTVNCWHQGKYDPTAESLIRLAEYFRCSVDYVLGREA